MQPSSKTAANGGTATAIRSVAGALFCIAAVCQPNFAHADPAGGETAKCPSADTPSSARPTGVAQPGGGGTGACHGGGGGGGFHGGGMGGFHGGGMGGFHGGGYGGHGGFAPGYRSYGQGYGGHWYHGWRNGAYGWWWDWGWPYYASPWWYYPDYWYGESEGQPYNAQTWYYYCSDPAGYYPYVTQCNTGWQAVPAS